MTSHAEHLASATAAHGTSPGWLDKQVRSFMRAGVITIPGDASVRQVQRALVAHKVHAVLVVDVRSGKPLGWAGARNVLGHMLGDAALMSASGAVTEPAESIAPSATAAEALNQMLETGARRLLVRRHTDSPPEGVVSEIDLVELAAPR
jgi:CBS domain-containing protein